MREILVSNDPVTIQFAEVVLSAAGIVFHVADRAMSLQQGSVALLPVRVLVASDQWAEARTELVAAGLGHAVVGS